MWLDTKLGETTPPSRAPHPVGLVVVPRIGSRKRVRKVRILSGLTDTLSLGVHNADLTNTVRALKERVFFVDLGEGFQRPPQPIDPNVFTRRLRRFSRLLVRVLPSTTPVTAEQFVESYRGRKKKIYQRALDSLAVKRVCRHDSHIKAFVKAEKIDVSKAPRLIQPRDPRYNLSIGRYIRHLEHLIYRAVDSVFGGPTIMKGYNSEQVAAHIVAKWERRRKPVGVGLDASRFDQHVSVQALEWEHGVYLQCYPAQYRDELRRLLRWQVHNIGRAYVSEGKVRYRVDGCRMSGDMNTALGNCLLMCALVWAYARSRGVDCDLVNNGDDCVVIMEEGDYNRFRDGLEGWFTDMGFTMKVEPPVRVLEQVEFCQAHPVYDGLKYTMVRNMKAFTKDGLCVDPLESRVEQFTWLDAMHQGGLSLTGGLPIWQDFYEVYGRLARLYNNPRSRRNRDIKDAALYETGMMQMARGMKRSYHAPSPAARYSFWRAFNITPDHQRAIEAKLQAFTQLSVESEVKHHYPFSGLSHAWGFTP